MTIPVKSIKVEQREGFTSQLISVTVGTIEDACAALRAVSRQCPFDTLSYLKTNVMIEWEDGTRRGFRCDINQHGADTNLTALLLDWARRNQAGSTEPNVKHFLRPEDRKVWEHDAARILSGELASL